MLKCNEVTRLGSDYLDKNLGWKDAFSIKMHIAMCKYCRRFIHHLRLTIHCVQGMKRDLASSGEIQRILDKIQDKNEA